MKQLVSVGISLCAIVVAGLFASGVWLVSAGAPPPAAAPNTPIATPNGFTAPSTPVDIRRINPTFKGPPHADRPTNTPLPIGQVTDLGPNYPTQCKSEVIVRRGNGRYEKFFVPIGQDLSKVKATLKQGDEIVLDGPPLAMMMRGVPYPPTIMADGRPVFGPTPTSECP